MTQLHQERGVVLKDIRIMWLVLSIAILCLIGLLPYYQLLPYLWWRYIHILSAALYSGVVVISALFEWKLSSRSHLNLFLSYSEQVASMDKVLITSCVSSLLISAIALLNYRGLSLWLMGDWPLWAFSSFTVLSMTGLLWAIFDVRTQHEIKVLANRLSEDSMSDDLQRELKRLLTIRHYINLFSVSTIPVLYFIMVFKPI